MKRIVMMALAALLVGAARGEAQSFTVVVNEANPVSSLSADDVSKMFLKRTRSWPAGSVSMSIPDLSMRPIPPTKCKACWRTSCRT